MQIRFREAGQQIAREIRLPRHRGDVEGCKTGLQWRQSQSNGTDLGKIERDEGRQPRELVRPSIRNRVQDEPES